MSKIAFITTEFKMSGHSKWSTIKHGKAVSDARRGKLFTRLTREIIAAVSQGGNDPDMNFRLRIGKHTHCSSSSSVDFFLCDSKVTKCCKRARNY